MSEGGSVVVTGATGMQGGAVVDALLKAGWPVRALVRDPESSAAQALAARGVALEPGTFDDPRSLERAMVGAFGVFSMQNVSPPDDPGRELLHAHNLVEAARATGVTAFVQTSVARAGHQHEFAGWAEGRWPAVYWNGKSEVNALVRTAGFARWTILKPAYMLDNFLPPKAAFMYPGLRRRVIETAIARDARLDVLAAADVGRFAAAAFVDPGRFSGTEIDLAAAKVTMSEVADAMAAATGESIIARTLGPDELIARGYVPGLVDNQLWATTEGYRVDLSRARSFGVPLESLADWATRNRHRFAFDPADRPDGHAAQRSEIAP